MTGLLWAALMMIAGAYGIWLVRLANRLDNVSTAGAVAQRAAVAANAATTRLEGRLEAEIKRHLRTAEVVDAHARVVSQHAEAVNRLRCRVDQLEEDVEPVGLMRREIETKIRRACEA